MTESEIAVITMAGMVFVMTILCCIQERNARRQQAKIARLEARIIDLEGWQ